MSMQLIKAIEVQEKRPFVLEYYLRDDDDYNSSGIVHNYEIVLIKKVKDKIIDIAYNRSPYNTLRKVVKFIKVLSLNKVTPISLNDLVLDFSESIK